MTILVVDDEPVSVRLLQLNLEHQGRTVATASSAAEALAWLAEAHGVELVITDNNLGGMSGLELFSALRADPRWRQLPVILCTAAADRATVDEAIRRGLRHFLVKPVRAAQLMEKVRQALADQPPILRHRFDGMAELGLSEVEYRMLLKASGERLSELETELARVRARADRDAAGDVVRRIREPVLTLGADRCAAAIAGFEGASEAGWAVALDRVVQELASLLEAIAEDRRPQSRL